LVDENSLLRAEHVCKEFDLGKIKIPVLHDININIKKGDFYSLMGPSGSGKSTLLHVLSALLRPTKGEVYIKNKPISKMNDSQLAIVRGQTIGFVFQNFNLVAKLSALENVMLPMWLQ